MKTVKMSLDTIQGKLSRTEMKEIMAGSGACGYMEYLFHCTWSSSSYGMSGGGGVCASDGWIATWEVANTLIREEIPGVNHVNCMV